MRFDLGLHIRTAVAVLMLAASAPAYAQFVCVDSSNSTQGAVASGSVNNMACGNQATADGANSANTSIGHGAAGYGDASGNSVVGHEATAYGDDSRNAVLGDFASGHGNHSANVAVGGLAAAYGMNSQNVGVGASSRAEGDNSTNTALGNGAASFGNNSANVAIGDFASAGGNGTRNTAVGAGAGASANSVAVGADSSASFSNSAAFGNNAVATRANQQMFGTGSSTYTMAGITSSDSKATQGGSTHLVTSNAGGDLAAYTFSELGLASSDDLASINARLGQVDQRLDGLDERSDKALQGVAMAFALAGSPSLAEHETFAISGNWGGYQGKSGMAFGAALKLDPHIQLNGGMAYGMNDGTVGGRAGVRLGW